MIIVEGADNVGKSTLVNTLLERDPTLQLLKRERFKPGMEGTIARTHIEALMPPDGDFRRHANSISDRTFFSECIYGPIFRGGCRMTPDEHFQLYALLQRYPTLVVWCDTNDETIKESWSKRAQLYERDPIAIAEAYRKHMPNLAFEMRLIRYDWTHQYSFGVHDPSRWTDSIIERILKLHRNLLDTFPLINTCT